MKRKINKGIWLFLWCVWMMGCSRQQQVEVLVHNPLLEERCGEIVEVAWKELENVLETVDPRQLIVYDAEQREIPSQVIYQGTELPVALIFPVSLASEEEKTFFIRKGQPASYEPLVYGRLVPERMDDFAWENNRVAYRVYGPALEATGEISHGIDVWCKGTERLVLNEWYKRGDYHRNHGDGMDVYAVGRTLGGGAMAPLRDGKLVMGNNFTDCRILDQGPLRFTFSLDYAPYEVGDYRVTERREISLDANTHFCRIRETYDGLPAGSLVAAGIVLRDQPGEIWRDTVRGVLGYWEPENWNNGENNGHLAVGIVFPHALKKIEETQGHLLAITEYPGTVVEYWMGTAWSQWGEVKEATDWFECLNREKKRLENPLIISINH